MTAAGDSSPAKGTGPPAASEAATATASATASEPPSEAAPLQLVPLGRMAATLRSPHVLAGTPAGDRWIFEVVEGSFEGDRLRATVRGQANADWFLLGPDGTGSLDVRVLVETHDGALVYVHYTGRVAAGEPGAPLYATPRFDTGDERYRWLNRIQAVAKGHLTGDRLTYEVYELR